MAGESIRLNLGCGSDGILAGYTNVDSHIDIYSGISGVVHDDAMTLYRLTRYKGRVDEILAVHLIEHLPRPFSIPPNVQDALRLWHEFLRPGGLLVLECPDFESVVTEYAETHNGRLKSVIFGMHRHAGDVHQWGYGPDDLSKLVRDAGFTVTRVCDGKPRGRDGVKSVRLEGVKQHVPTPE